MAFYAASCTSDEFANSIKSAGEPLPDADHHTTLIRRAEADHIMGYLAKPMQQADLGPVIALAMHRFAQFHELGQEAAHLRQALEGRKLIEGAKGALMKRVTLDEQSAFRRLQKLVSNKNLKMAPVARMILTAGEAFAGP
jgi:response regulator NasT